MVRFWITETFISINKAKASFLLSVISATFAVSLVLLSAFVVISTTRFDQTLKEKMSLNLILKEDPGQDKQNLIGDELSRKKYVKNFIYRSKSEAAEKFIKETGEDFTKILDYNPLPASFEVFLKEGYVQKDSIENICSELRNTAGIDEVYFSAEIYYKIIDYLNKAKSYIIGLTILLCVVSFYLVYSTNRLILNHRIEEMNTMKLIGATLMNIKMPVILNSIFIGLISGGLSLIIYILLRNYLSLLGELPDTYLKLMYVIALLLGPLFGIITSLISMRKININI